MHVAYIVSRFPHASETFIARELSALEDAGGTTVELMSLFPAVDATVHPSAARWTERLARPGLGDALAAVVWWAVHRPVRLLTTIAVVLREHLRSPATLARALVTLPLAAAHARVIRMRGVKHVHAHYATYPGLSAWISWRLVGTPYSITAHAHDIFVNQRMLARKLADAAFVVTISEYNRGFLAQYGESERIHVLHAGIDPEAYPYRPRAVPAEGPVRALCVASLQEYKGHTVLFDALAHEPALDRVELDLVGAGPLRAALELRTRELGLADRVRFHGSASEDTVRGLLECADLFVLPSLIAHDGQMEGLPVVLMEALASGVPVVATRLSGIPELVTDGLTGLLAAPGDAGSLRQALERALNGDFKPDLQAGRALVEREFDVDSSAARLRELFATALDTE